MIAFARSQALLCASSSGVRGISTLPAPISGLNVAQYFARLFVNFHHISSTHPRAIIALNVLAQNVTPRAVVSFSPSYWKENAPAATIAIHSRSAEQSRLMIAPARSAPPREPRE